MSIRGQCMVQDIQVTYRFLLAGEHTHPVCQSTMHGNVLAAKAMKSKSHIKLS